MLATPQPAHRPTLATAADKRRLSLVLAVCRLDAEAVQIRAVRNAAYPHTTAWRTADRSYHRLRQRIDSFGAQLAELYAEAHGTAEDGE